ncbi:MAG: DNA (cytosine-5-)-methyltransferase [Prochloraceae cyanobacterium]|nr:DNA (cytosine-5-)-methyltransferase [Prochloraceae cyanobacterium]
MKKNSRLLITNVLNADIDGEWFFHPKPQSKPITIKEAFKDLPEKSVFEFKYLSENLQKACQEYYKINPHKNYRCRYMREALLKHTGKTGGFIGFMPLYWKKVAPTVTKQWIARAGLIHPSGKRYLSIEEIQRLCSFPDDFIFVGSFEDRLARMGNSVPPLLARAIALNLKQSSFLKKVDSPTVVSLFAGCGGSSLGFHLAGFKELLAVEWDDNAIATFKMNFPNVPVFHGDIAKLSVEEALNLTGLKPKELDCLQGSPPCQGFSTVGKRRATDSRNTLFKEFVRLVQGFQPKCFVMENVSGIVKGHMKPFYLSAVSDLRSCGYKVKGQLLNSKYYGVPQSRERVIVVGARNDLF